MVRVNLYIIQMCLAWAIVVCLCFPALLLGQAQLTQPVNTLPHDGETIHIKRPILQWLPALPASGVVYSLRIVELIEGQSAMAAIQSNPSIFQREGLQQNAFAYPLVAPKLNMGQCYVWQVKAVSKSNSPQFKSTTIGETQLSYSQPTIFCLIEKGTEDIQEKQEKSIGTYYRLSLSRHNGRAVCSDGTLRFELVEAYGFRSRGNQLKVQILDDKRNLISEKRTAAANESRLKHLGHNRFELSLSDYSKLKTGRTYTLRLSDPNKRTYTLQFIVTNQPE